MGPDTMTGGAGIWISGRCQLTVNDEPLPERAPGDASACATVAYRRPKLGLASSVSALTWPGTPVIEPVRPPAEALAPVNVTLPKSARDRMWQSWVEDDRHRDGASAIHSAEETVGLLICSCLLNVACRVRLLSETVTVGPLTATCALSRSPGRTVMVTGTWAAGTSSYQAE